MGECEVVESEFAVLTIVAPVARDPGTLQGLIGGATLSQLERGGGGGREREMG